MKRAALIVSSPGTVADGEDAFLLGVEADAEFYQEFLQSDAGGAWRPNEIGHFRFPQKADLLTLLSRVRVDYSITVFCGHGGMAAGRPFIEINPDEQLLVRDFRTKARRQLTIIDSCRTELVREPYPIKLGEATFGYEGSAGVDAYRESCRAAYDYRVGMAPEQRVMMWGCNIGQTAGENQFGGYFSQALLAASTDWAYEARAPNARRATQYLDVRKAFGRAKASVTLEHYPQEPQIESGRGHVVFPFAVA